MFDLWSVFRETGEPMSYVFFSAMRDSGRSKAKEAQMSGKNKIPRGRDGKKPSDK